LGRGDHFAEVEQRLDQGGRVGVDLLREIGQRRAAGEADDLTVTAWQPHTADRRCLHRIVFLALLPLRLTTTPGRATGTAEGTGRATATTGPTRTAATGTAAEAAT